MRMNFVTSQKGPIVRIPGALNSPSMLMLAGLALLTAALAFNYFTQVVNARTTLLCFFAILIGAGGIWFFPKGNTIIDITNHMINGKGDGAFPQKFAFRDIRSISVEQRDQAGGAYSFGMSYPWYHVILTVGDKTTSVFHSDAMTDSTRIARYISNLTGVAFSGNDAPSQIKRANRKQYGLMIVLILIGIVLTLFKHWSAK